MERPFTSTTHEHLASLPEEIPNMHDLSSIFLTTLETKLGQALLYGLRTRNCIQGAIFYGTLEFSPASHVTDLNNLIFPFRSFFSTADHGGSDTGEKAASCRNFAPCFITKTLDIKWRFNTRHTWRRWRSRSCAASVPTLPRLQISICESRIWILYLIVQTSVLLVEIANQLNPLHRKIG